MNGIAVITNGTTWAITNLADYSSIPERDGKTFKNRTDLKLISIFGEATLHDSVECLFKPDAGKGEVIGIKGIVRAVVNGTAYINVTGILENTQEIYSKILKLGGK